MLSEGFDMQNMPLCMQKTPICWTLVRRERPWTQGRRSATAALAPSRSMAELFCHQLPLRQSAGPGFCHRWRRFIVDTAVDVARKELATIGVEPPAPGELRRVVRLALSDVRRGRTGWGVRTLLGSPEGAAYLRNFVLKFKS